MTDLRCKKCNKLLAKALIPFKEVQIKCDRCKEVVTFTGEARVPATAS